jgi:hypothetical protein
MASLDISNGCGSCETFGDVPMQQQQNFMGGSNQQNMGNMMSNNQGQVYTNPTNALNQAMQSAGVLGSNNSIMNGTSNGQPKPMNQNVQPQQPSAPPMRVATPTVAYMPEKKHMPLSVRAANFAILTLVVVSALATNEAVKYYINQAIKFNDGSPMYYVGYAVLAMLMTGALYHYTK